MIGIFQVDYCITHQNAVKFRESGWGTEWNWRKLCSKNHCLTSPPTRSGEDTVSTGAEHWAPWLGWHWGLLDGPKTPTATAVRDFPTVSIPVPYSTRFSVWDGYFWLAKPRRRHLCSSCKRGWETTHLPFLVSMEGSSLCLSWFWTHFQQVGVVGGLRSSHTPPSSSLDQLVVYSILTLSTPKHQIPQVKGSVPQDCLPFWMPVQSPSCHLCFWPAGYGTEAPMRAFLGSINLC